MQEEPGILESVPQSELVDCIRAFESLRGRPAMLYLAFDEGAPRLSNDDIDVFYRCLREQNTIPARDVLLSASGGYVTAARRLGLLLRHYSKELTVFVPDRAHSAASLLCLAANEIVLSPRADLSPMDPMMHNVNQGAGPGSKWISSEEVRAFPMVAKEWFQIASEEARVRLLELVSQHTAPLTISALFRATEYVRESGVTLLQYQLPKASIRQRRRIVDHLIKGFHEHRQGLTAVDLAAAGLRARLTSEAEEELMDRLWLCGREYMRGIGFRGPSVSGRVSAMVASPTFIACYVQRHMPINRSASGGSRPESTVFGATEWLVLSGGQAMRSSRRSGARRTSSGNES